MHAANIFFYMKQFYKTSIIIYYCTALDVIQLKHEPLSKAEY